MTKAPAALASLLATIIGCLGCGAPAMPTAPPAPMVFATFLTLTGNVVLPNLGDKSQLAVVANLSDNTTKDVTAACGWSSSRPTVATISSTGVLTATGFGETLITCTYQARSVSKTATTTALGPFFVTGRVSQPDDSDFFLNPIAGVLVVDQATGRFATTDTAGRFTLGGLLGPGPRLQITKDGFESSDADVTYQDPELPMQRTVRLNAGETVQPWPLVEWHDLRYTIDGSECFPCRRIRVVVARAGVVNVRLTWTNPLSAVLTLFAEGRVLSGASAVSVDLPIDGPREVVMYVGGAEPRSVRTYTPFTFATTMR